MEYIKEQAEQPEETDVTTPTYATDTPKPGDTTETYLTDYNLIMYSQLDLIYFARNGKLILLKMRMINIHE